MKRLLLLLLFGIIVGMTSCSIYINQQNVEIRFEKEYYYKPFFGGIFHSKWITNSVNRNYIRYDKKGNIIEVGEYGEEFHFGSYKKHSDNSESRTYGEGCDYEKLKTVHFIQYDSTNKKIADEFWKFIDNKKSNLISKTIFEYDSTGQFSKETEYKENNIVSCLIKSSKKEKKSTILTSCQYNYNSEGLIKDSIQIQDTILNDSLGRPIEKNQYINGKFSYKTMYFYNTWTDSGYDKLSRFITEIQYENKPDSLYSITELNYDYLKNLTSESVKVIGNEIEKELYIYNLVNNLLVKKIHYSGEDIEYFTKYKYRQFKTE
ncbi:MAG: hypothetical protein WCP69_15420 [Bacteroidota bacterium]